MTKVYYGKKKYYIFVVFCVANMFSMNKSISNLL